MRKEEGRRKRGVSNRQTRMRLDTPLTGLDMDKRVRVPGAAKHVIFDRNDDRGFVRAQVIVAAAVNLGLRGLTSGP
jgi:hypothetical protein